MGNLLSRVALATGSVMGLLLAGYIVLSDPIGRGCATVRDTVVVSRIDTVWLPPDTVIVMGHSIIKVDTAYKARAESLIAVVTNKDSLIRELLEPQTAQVQYRKVKDSVQVIGSIVVDYFPLDRQFAVINQIDTLTLPVRTEIIHETLVVHEADPTTVVVSVGAGILCGGALVWFLSN